MRTLPEPCSWLDGAAEQAKPGAASQVYLDLSDGWLANHPPPKVQVKCSASHLLVAELVRADL